MVAFFYQNQCTATEQSDRQNFEDAARVVAFVSTRRGGVCSRARSTLRYRIHS
jgi:hypothetical protein